jgi:uncharacterized RDD family membrane protein YckC
MNQQTDLELKTSTGIDIRLPLAGVGSRSYAFIIDWHIRVGICIIWTLASAGILFQFDWSKISENNQSLLWTFLVPSLVYTLYHPVVELAMRGNTPGKIKAGIACVDQDGNTPTSGAIVLRNIMRLIDSLPFMYTVGLIAMILTKQQVRIGDMVAGTRMIVNEGNNEEALTKLQTVRDAKIEPQQAELVYDLLTRWKILQKEKRRDYASALLKQASVRPALDDKSLKRQLEELLGR